MATMRSVRSMALSLPETIEQDHHGMPSFRVRGKIFATVPDAAHLRVMVDEREARAACAEVPASCELLFWGQRLSGVVVEVRTVPAPLLRELLEEAWRRKAPPVLVRALDTSGH
jgi:hypothetical protein